MLGQLALNLLLFAIAILGGGAALAPARRGFAPLEAWCIGIAGSVGVLALGVSVAYVAGLPNAWFATGFFALAVTALARRSAIADLARDPDVREAALTWTLLVFGCLAVLTCVVSYNGGFWMGDWEEQYQRPLLFLRERQDDAAFRSLVVFTGRPPLANLAEAALLWITGSGFAHHQVTLLLLNSLAFLPAALFARTLGGGRCAHALVAALFLLNPLFLQNATYAWTKLLAAFFVLIGLHALLMGDASRRRVVVGFGLLGLGVLTHYSSCVWLLVFGGAWLFTQRARWRDPDFLRTLAAAAAMFAAVLSPWVVYAIARYGLVSTLASNTSAATAAQFTWWENLLSIGPKLWATLVPCFLRSFDQSLLLQSNAWALLRDQAFCAYQSNLFLAVGTPTLLVLFRLAVHTRACPRSWLWPVAVPAVIVLGTAVVGHIDYWGSAQICLQPLILLAIALAAARLPELLHRTPAAAAATGLAVAGLTDFSLGIGIHYYATALQLNRPPGQDLLTYIGTLNRVAQHNLWQKARLGQDWFADTFPLSPWLALTLLASLTLYLAARAHRLATVAPATAPQP